jgi:indolepyruvate ferredoxin oxidoreductase beta subunit
MSHVRVSCLGQYGPLIPLKQADIIVGFEPIETLRVVRDYANQNSKVIFDPRPNYPLGVLIGEAVYPEIAAIDRELQALCGSVQIVNATQMAIEAGNPQAANITIMGALTALADIPLDLADFYEILQTRFVGEVLELNKMVLNWGMIQLPNNLGFKLWKKHREKGVCMISLNKDLIRLLSDKQVLSQPEDLMAYASDATHYYASRIPDAVVLPANTEDVALVMKYAFEQNIPVTPRGAGSGLGEDAPRSRAG